MIAFILCACTIGALGLLFVVPGAKLYDDSVERMQRDFRLKVKPVEGHRWGL